MRAMATTRRMLALMTAVMTMALLGMATAQCVYTPTKCQCAEAQAGRLCLRYLGGATDNLQCESYVCGTGYVCACGGTQMCNINDCTSMRDVYRASANIPLTAGETVACELAPQVTCVTLISPSPTPSPTPLPNPRQLGQACDAAHPCAAALGCDCVGVCRQNVSMDIVGLGDDSLALWLCGAQVGATANMGKRTTWSYNGPCPSVYLYVTNANWKSGISVAVQDKTSGGTTWYAGKTDGSQVTGIAGVDLSDTDFFSDPAYDFGTWVDVVFSANHASRAPWVAMANDYGSEPWSFTDTSVSGSDIGNTWYKVTLPFCT